MVQEFQPPEPVQEFAAPELDLGLIEHEIPNPVKRPPKIKLSQIRKKMVLKNDKLNETQVVNQDKKVMNA
jgi:hypothetical protein